MWEVLLEITSPGHGPGLGDIRAFQIPIFLMDFYNSQKSTNSTGE